MKKLLFSATLVLAFCLAFSSCKYFKVGEVSTRYLIEDTTATLLKAWDKAYPMGWMAEEVVERISI